MLGNSYVYKTKHEVRDISACEVCLQIGGQTDEINVMSMLLVQIIDDPCFDILRTKFVNVNLLHWSGLPQGQKSQEKMGI